MKVVNVDDWRTDAQLVENGARCEIGEGRAFIVRRAGTRNRLYMAALAGVNTEDEASMMQVIARTVVIGWEGFADDSGAPVPYSADECIEMFVACPELYDRVLLFGHARGNYRAAQLDEEKQQVKGRPGGARVQARTARN